MSPLSLSFFSLPLSPLPSFFLPSSSLFGAAHRNFWLSDREFSVLVICVLFFFFFPLFGRNKKPPRWLSKWYRRRVLGIIANIESSASLLKRFVLGIVQYLLSLPFPPFFQSRWKDDAPLDMILPHHSISLSLSPFSALLSTPIR